MDASVLFCQHVLHAAAHLTMSCGRWRPVKFIVAEAPRRHVLVAARGKVASRDARGMLFA